ncbi:MAG: winged helix-turn-helix domain-containing protein [Desulfobulbaceae bacterium]|nr:winged helix-turn-helix domain-containing protein [Desulfobulbaceae bacterium]
MSNPTMSFDYRSLEDGDIVETPYGVGVVVLYEKDGGLGVEFEDGSGCFLSEVTGKREHKGEAMQKVLIEAGYSFESADDMIKHLSANGFSVDARQNEGKWKIAAVRFIDPAKEKQAEDVLLAAGLLPTDQFTDGAVCVVEDFVATVCEKVADFAVPVKDLYDAFVEYCDGNGFSALSPRSFSSRLKSLGYVSIKRGGNVVFIGLRLHVKN